jgi:uncharacterized membrane protein YGL010W
MNLNDVLMFAVPTMIFACGAALLSYRFYAAYQRWPIGDFSYKLHLPGILGAALMLFATLCASSLGWAHVTVAVLGGFAVSHLYMHVFRMWVEIALLGPLLAVASVFLMRASSST